MPTVDAMIARYSSPRLEERNHFVEGLVAECPGRQPRPQLPGNGTDPERPGPHHRDRHAAHPAREASRITIESRNRIAEIDDEMAEAAPPGRRALRRVPLGAAPMWPS